MKQSEAFKMISLLFSLIFCIFFTKSESACSDPIGLIDGRIQDWQLSSSSYLYRDHNCHPKYARLYSDSGRGWCPNMNASGEYLQIDLGVTTSITCILTQGRSDGRYWTRSFYLSYSDDALNWNYYNHKQKLLANRNSHSVHAAFLQYTLHARFVRFEIVDWHLYPSLRVELLGCQKCNAIINYPPRGLHSASSSKHWHREKGCDASDSFIDGASGWCAKWNNHHQWISIDVGPPSKIVGVVTRGRGGMNRHEWVTAYSISYSNDSRRWSFIKSDETNVTTIKNFGGNMDGDTRRWHYFVKPFVARYIRLNPVSWKSRISMRVGVIGCQVDEQCSEGFLRINNDSECVTNLAYRRTTWINDKRHSWTQWTYGHSDLAVDGYHDNIASLNKCAILDNYFVETPMWMVDLKDSHKINGVVIISWPGHYTHHNHLEKLVIKIANTGKIIGNDTVSRECGQISYNQLVSSSRIHIACESHLIGQFVYIAAHANHSSNQMLFSAILCEVFVY